jgi:peptidyl-prolyl cis-trans isomerase SurA
MRNRLGSAAPRRMLSGASVASLLLTVVATLAGTAVGQVQAPKYRSPIEAPKPQVTLPAPTAITTNGTVVAYPIVRVNNQIIDNADYERAERQLTAEAQQSNVTGAELEQRRKDMLRDMIDQQLLLSRGKELDINADSEVIRRLDDIRKQNHLDSMEDLEKAVRESGVSVEDFKSNIKNSIITQEVVRDEVGRNLRLTAKDEQAYYDQHKQEFEQPEQVRLSEILVPTPDGATDEQIAQAKAKADDVVAKLKAGAKFEDMVKQYSGGPNPESGGDLGDFKRGALGSKALEDPTFVLKAGESTAPIRTRQGFVILKVTEHTAAGVPPLSAVEPQVQQAIYEQAIQPALRAYLTKLRENAYIDVAPGFVDSGASAKETKPVYAGATPLPVKKKKVQKARLERGRTVTPTTAAATASSTTPGASQPGSAGVATTPSTVAASPSAKPVGVATGKKRTKIRREKIRFGQAPRNALPEAPEETLAAGADQGPGAASVALPASTEASTSSDQTNNVAANVDMLAPAEPERKKTRFSARAATEAKTKAAAKVAKVKEKAAITPAPLTAEEKATQAAQSAPLGLSGDTASKKKKAKVKGAPKERIQQKAPAPPAPKPDATPIPPKSVRDNGEPVVTPVPVDTPSTPVSPAPAPPQ